MSCTVLICEDEPLARETLRDFIAGWPALRLVGEAADGREALEAIRRLAPDIVFLDIQMPEMTGLEVLRQLADPPCVVFTTAYDEYAVTAFELDAVDYLLKPFSRERFDLSVQRLLDDAAARRDSAERAQAAAQAAGPGSGPSPSAPGGAAPGAPLTRILVRDRGKIFPLALDEIAWLRSDSKYTQIAARGSQFLVRVALSAIEARLDPARFVRVHRNALINLDHVDSMQPDEQSQLEIRMRDGTVLLANREASRRLRDQAW